MEILFCGKCGAQLRAEDRFCPNCGEDARKGEEISIVLPRGVTKINVTFAEKASTAEETPARAVSELPLDIPERAVFAADSLQVPEPCYMEALQYVVSVGSASISMLQRKLAIGYPKAGHIIEWMESNGFISPFKGASARKVYLTQEQLRLIQENQKGRGANDA